MLRVINKQTIYIMLSLQDGERLVRYARDVIERHVRGLPLKELENYEEKRGVFVTINKGKNLRGCIGIPEPIMSLNKAIKEAAVSACHDPRFPDLRENELDEIVVEVSVLTPPRLIESDPANYPKEIKVGRDGLIVERGFYKGLLLPQVAVEYKWNSEEFLAHTCMKAGLHPNAWMDRETKVYRFEGEVFAEKEPRGEIIRLKLD